MEEKLRTLYNTLMTIETKGGNTLVMADCLVYLKKLVEEVQNETGPVSANESSAK
jgi:hypothetical protein